MQKRRGEGLYRSQVFLEAFLEFSSAQHYIHGSLDVQRNAALAKGMQTEGAHLGQGRVAGDSTERDGCRVCRGTQTAGEVAAGERRTNRPGRGLGQITEQGGLSWTHEVREPKELLRGRWS